MIPRSILLPARAAQLTEPEEAMEHQMTAVEAAWHWGLAAFAARPEHRGLSWSVLAERWTSLAGEPRGPSGYRGCPC